MSTRAMAWLFFFLTIINLPAYAYYYKGTSSDADGETTLNQASAFTDYFKLLSLGNVGQSSYACAFSNFAEIKNQEDHSYNQDVHLSCGLGS